MATTRAKTLSKNILKSTTRKKAMLDSGYSESYANSGKIRQTKSYKEATETVVAQLEREQVRIIKALSRKGLSKEKYKDLVDSLDKITKNIQLLSGKPTEIHDDYRQLSDEELRRLSEEGKSGVSKKGASKKTSR